MSKSTIKVGLNNNVSYSILALINFKQTEWKFQFGCHYEPFPYNWLLIAYKMVALLQKYILFLSLQKKPYFS